jgi:ABC-type cobalamin transport system permease subunit
VLAAAVALAIAALRSEAALGAAYPTPITFLALGLSVGAVGPLAFVGTFVPRAVRALAPAASPRAWLATSAVAGAATVAAVDAVPRLLLGGYDFPFNVAAGMLALPVFLGWNRARLRREAGRAHVAFEAAELVLIFAMTAAAAGLAALLSNVIRVAT